MSDDEAEAVSLSVFNRHYFECGRNFPPSVFRQNARLLLVKAIWFSRLHQSQVAYADVFVALFRDEKGIGEKGRSVHPPNEFVKGRKGEVTRNRHLFPDGSLQLIQLTQAVWGKPSFVSQCGYRYALCPHLLNNWQKLCQVNFGDIKPQLPKALDFPKAPLAQEGNGFFVFLTDIGLH